MIGANAGTAAKLYVAGEGIGKVNMMMRMFNAIHDPDIGLRRQYDTKGHAEDGNCSSKSADSLPVQLGLFALATARKATNCTTI